MEYIRSKSKVLGWYPNWHIRGEEHPTLCEVQRWGDEVETTDELPSGHRVCSGCACVYFGYEAERTQGGQTRRYGPTVYVFHVKDLRGGRSKDEVLDFCRTYLYRAMVEGEDGYHSLRPHVMGFGQTSDGTYVYKAGHEYTG
jgi:hypothetical protein